MIDIKKEWFNDDESPKVIKVPSVKILASINDVLCYLLSLNLYPKFVANKTIISWIVENDNVGFLQIVGNNLYTCGHMQFKFTSGE